MSRTRTLTELVEAMRSFQESRTLLTAVELDIFGAVQAGASAMEVAERCNTNPRATAMLLDALVALGALLKREDVYHCTRESATLAQARTGLMHTVHLWKTWSGLTSCVENGKPAAARGPEAFPPEQTRAFIAAMHNRAREAAEEILHLVPVQGALRMLDVGGGSAAFSIAFASHCPELQAEVLDLEAVLPIAEEHIRQAGLEARVKVRAGEMLSSDLGQDHDLVLLSAVLHMFGEEDCQRLILRSAEALKPGGRLIIREFILEEDRTAPTFAALFALNMLVGTEHGNTYTESQYREWMGEAGLVDISRPDPDGDVLVGLKP